MVGDRWIDGAIGLINTFRTAYRRIDHPNIGPSHLVIDVGCGGNPNPRANVACDFMPDDYERGESLQVDCPFFWADSARLPLRTGAFDYSILCHVLEHVREPGKTLDELQRISRAGYIETPNAFHEFIIPYTTHISRCTVVDGKLRISFKRRWDETLDDPELADVRNDMHMNWWDLHNREARALLTRFRWRGRIDYEVRGTVMDSKPLELMTGPTPPDSRSWLRRSAVSVVRFALRPRRITDLRQVLACPLCHGDLEFAPQMEKASCPSCNKDFGTLLGHLDFRVNEVVEIVAA
jgi:hypothetical protein